ncbi:MAG: SRPBCC domain-containing protein [Actinomycetales bacterium]|nr:SRPBCC domain-containing protein [Actinomycetales bacterium]
MTTNGTMRALDAQRGAARVEELYDTDVRDLWEACTSPERLARWLAYVSGDLHVGGTIEMTFTSTWTGPAKIERCDAPHHLLLTTEPGTDDECQLEAWLTDEGAKSRLVVEERGLPLDRLHFHGAGWHTHLEDLARSIRLGGSAHPDGWSATRAAPDWRSRWVELTPGYAAMPVAYGPT